MCGIGAVFGKGADSSTVKKSLSKIKHRGQNHYEMKSLPNCVIGANRLAIVDRVNGKQPFSNERETVFAVLNGEIFNYKELKTSLKKKGHNFRTNCDTEVLVHLWEEYGTNIVKHIDSEMFAFVIYDSEKDEYFIARDPIGVKPLYYAYDSKKRFHVASEIKQLSQFSTIKEIKEFPSGHYYHKKKFTKYFEIQSGNKLSNKNSVKKELKKKLENAVKKRVQTDLPIGVFLSGGVDSSLIMELASKFHHDVTAIILGLPGSTDFENAIRFCRERNYPYQIVYPNPNYEKEIDELIYHLESYEPLIIRQAFANDIISKAAAKLGLKITLVGEGADELFAGYNEFSHLSEKNVNKGCELLLQSLAKGHLMRVDKLAMKHTLEVRCPFFDNELVKYSMNIHGTLKVSRENHRITTKKILREVASEYLPDYIAYRFKAPFANGAGLDIGFNYKSEDGILAKIAHKHTKKNQLKQLAKKYTKYNFSTREELFYFGFYKKYNYNKFNELRYRLVVKDNLIDLEDASEGTRMLIAEFDRLALYFPVYLAAKMDFFKKHGLNIDFIATGGDDKTYAALIQNSAQLGMADPMFAMIDNPYAVKGEIVGELVNSPPLYVVSFKPHIKVNRIEDLEDYKIGTFRHWHIGTYEQFSTTNTITRGLLSKAQVSAVHHSEIEEALYTGDIDVAILLAEQAYNLESKGAHKVFSIKKIIPHFLFTGFTVSENLEERYRKELPKFLQAVNDAIKYITKNKAEAQKVFKKEFNLAHTSKIFDDYYAVWSKDLKIPQADWDKALHYWRKLYPHLLHDINPFFLEKKKEDLIFELFSRRSYSRNRPHKEFIMKDLIRNRIKENEPIKLVGFWGASDKKEINEFDHTSIKRLKELNENVKKLYKPGLQFVAILADEHAYHNGYPKKHYQNYLKQIKSILVKEDWQCIYLSQLWKKHKLTEKKITVELNTKPKGWWSKVKASHKLSSQAAKHAKSKESLQGAQFYYLMRKQEANILEKEFPKAIFWAYSNDSMNEVYPNMPTLYFYSTKKGVGISPWFSH